ncbi:hypothetical protein GOP47_0028523 [Adiantum capillus-veneris]|nr:hypothetical protein GOP47_0028523 [Adiantum capillus-veneris]
MKFDCKLTTGFDGNGLKRPVARKATGSSALKGKRRCTSLDTEEGEILSDEDAAGAMVTASTVGSTASEIRVDHSSDASTKQRGTLSVSREFLSSISTESPSLVAVVPSHNNIMNTEGICNLASDRPSVVSKDESGTAQAAVGVDSTAKSELPKFNQRMSGASNGPRPFRSATGSLTSRIPAAPLPPGGLRKEAEAFLASLNIPAMASSTHLSSFTGDRHNSLVIKFSDDDSDSDGEQDGQVAKDRVDSKKLIGSESQTSGNLANPRTGLVSQTTSGLISKIDSVKKQIAAIERAKGSPPVSKPSKSTAVEVPRQLNLKTGVPTTAGSSRMVAVDLESLRQQIAAKESELKRRKQRGSKEFSNNAAASSWLIDTLEAPDARSLPIEKSESQAGVVEVCIDDVPVMSETETNEAFNNSNGLSVKIKRLVTQGADFERANSLSDGVAEMVTSIDILPAAPATEFVTVNSSALFIDNNGEQVLSEITDFASEKCHLPSIAAKDFDMPGNKASFTPKRKRQESDLKSESVKRVKTKGQFFIPESNLILTGSKGEQDYQFVGSFSDGNNVASMKVSGGIQSSQSKEPLMPVQGMPMALAMTKSPQDKDVQTISMQKVSGGKVFAHYNCQIPEVIADNHNNHVPGAAVILQKPGTEDLLGNEVSDATLQLDVIAQNADRLKHLGTSTDTALSSHFSPSRAMAEQQENFGVISREQNMLQRTLFGTSSTCSSLSSLPIWDCSNSQVQLLQGVSNQRLEYLKDSLWKMQEEEDVVDKELEEAQQNRRRCEVREHFARKQYRDAQEALHAANVRCEMLFQKREMLCASVKAAQLRLYSNRSSLTPHHSEGAMISLSVPECSGRDAFSFETSMWARDKRNRAKAIVESDQDNEGSHSDFVSVFNQARTSSRVPSGGCFIAEAQQCSANVNGLEEAVVLKSPARESMEGLSTKPSMYLHDNVSKVPGIKPYSPQQISTVSSADHGPPAGDSIPASVSQCKIGAKNSQTSSEGRLPSIGLTVAVNGSIENDSHGFSSASFATDLWRDGSWTSMLGEKINILKEQDANMRQSSSSRTFQQVSLIERNDNVKESSAATLKVPSTVMNEVSSLKCPQWNSEPESVAHLGKTSGLLEEQLQQGAEPVTVEEIDRTRKHISTILTVADSSFSRQDSGPLEAHMSSADSLNELSLSKDVGMEQENSKDIVTHDGKLMMNFPDNHELPVVGPGKAWQMPVGNAETESDTVIMQKRLFEMSHEDLKLEQCTGPVNLLTTAGLNLLFSHVPDSHSSNIWKQLIVPDKADETTHSVPVNFESPLAAFRFHRGVLQSMDASSPNPFSGSHRLDPHRILCMFEHRGKCNNDECIWQHKRDYLLSSSQKQLYQVVEVSKLPEATGTTVKEDVNPTDYLKYRDGDRDDDENTLCSAPLQTSWRWNGQTMKVPMYSIGPHLRIQSLKSPLPGIISKRQFESGVPFLALHTEASMDLPYLFDSSLKLPTLNDGSIASRQLRIEDTMWIQDEGRDFGTLGDAESLLEAALELCHYDMKVQKSELRKSVLYVLSRGLEANPGSVALWVVYLHLFYKWEQGSSKDDLFLSAVQHNDGSYELWMMFIDTRWQLKDRLEAYESAIITLGSRVDLQCHASEGKSSLLLDLALRRLNCLCTSDLSEEATNWITNFTLLASEEGQGCGRHEASSSLTLVDCLSGPDLCILWICCAYVILQRELPDRVVESLGCKQELFFENIWSGIINMSSCTSQAVKLMRIAASQGKGCMKLDVHEPEDTNLQLAKEVFAANFVQCVAVCEGLDSSLTLAEKYFRMFSPSVELTLLRARHEEHHRGKMASLEIFEEALIRWPLDRTGKMRLWNQYIECAYEPKGPDFVKGLLARCAKEICDSDSFRFVCGNVGTGSKDSEQPQQQGSPMSVDVSDTSFRSAFQLLPLIVKRQLMKGSGFSSQRFSFQDAVFAYVNLAFLETLSKDYKAARTALQNGLNVAVDADSVRHCLKEIAVFTYKGLDNSIISSPTEHLNKMLGLVDRCIVESQLVGAVHPLSRDFCDTIQSRRLSQFVGSLLCPLPTDSSFLNSILESIHGPTLLPSETLAWTELLEIAEKLLEILPSNVRLASSICRAVQNKASGFDSKQGLATLFWCTSLLIDSLCKTSPAAPEPRWVEAGGFLKMLEVDSLHQDFYWLALLVHPHSTSLWHGLLEVSRKTGNVESVLKSAKEKEVRSVERNFWSNVEFQNFGKKLMVLVQMRHNYRARFPDVRSVILFKINANRNLTSFWTGNDSVTALLLEV